MLRVDHLAASYGAVRAVGDVSIEASPGRISLVLGPNGAGKTTLLRTISGLHQPDAGSVTLDGENVTGRASHVMVAKGLVMVPEGRRVFASLTVAENLRLGGHRIPYRRHKTLIEQVHGLFPILRERASMQAGLLSGGEQQMLAFGRALMAQPRVVLMDEPSMGLAPSLVDTVFEQVRTIAASGVAVVMVEQNADAAFDVADSITVIDRGQIVFVGNADDTTSRDSLLATYLGESALLR